MPSKIKIGYKRVGLICTLSIIILFMTVFIGKTYADKLDNHVKVKSDTDLIYYLNVEYGGKDESGIESSDEVTANVKSDYIDVEDKLPDGLAFKEVKGTDTGQIIAVTKKDGNACSGYVVDGVKGIKYNEETRTVSFKIKNLGAGCRITVGIITTTPEDNGKRQDFYNTFQAVEDDLTSISNTVHVYMGDDKTEVYEVKYEYTGTVPTNAPSLPTEMKYAKDTEVSVANNVKLNGYQFSGWTSEDVDINDGTFTMPENEVILKGSFTKKQGYKVIYEIEGDAPKDYVAPSDEEYYENTNVTLDSLKVGDIVDGYKFLGWKTDDVTLPKEEDNEIVFQMPNHNVTIKGEFKRISYKVSYEFIGASIPNDSDSLLPKTKEYYPGDKVTLENPKEIEGYKFLGWYKKDNFKMPEENVVIQGEWAVCAGFFEPEITKEVINKKDYYKVGDKVEFKITVKNTSTFDLTDVMVSENNDKARFISGDGYKVSSLHIATIPLVKAGETVTLYAEYTVIGEDKGIITNEAEIIGALAENNYYLKDKDYKATAQFEVKEQQNSEVKPGVENPTTLDNIIKYVIIAVISLVAIIGIVIVVKKVNKK